MSDELHSLRAVDDILARHDADEVRRMLGWLTDKYVGSTTRASPARTPSDEPPAEPSGGEDVEPSGDPRPGIFDVTPAEPGMRAVEPVGIADVDFAPEGKPDAKRYNDVWGSPDDDRVKCLEATHWFSEVGGVADVTPEHVHAYFIEKGWEVPDDLLDAIDRAGVKGYLTTGERSSIGVAPDGRRLMESSLSYAGT